MITVLTFTLLRFSPRRPYIPMGIGIASRIFLRGSLQLILNIGRSPVSAARSSDIRTGVIEIDVARACIQQNSDSSVRLFPRRHHISDKQN